VKPGDDVITSPFTFVATANAILMAGARVVFADVDEETFTIDPVHVERKITDKTKALLPVDLYGLPADYAELKALIMHHNHAIKIIADACQAVGAQYDGELVGSIADVSAFSLYATKNIMCGEGGIVTTNNDAYAEHMRKFRHHGQNTQYSYEFLGYNYRMTDLHAAIAIEQLKNADAWTKKRQHNARLMSELLAGVSGITLPVVPAHSTHVFHQYTIRVRSGRDKLAAYLTEHGVGCKVFYPTPLHLEAHLRAGYNNGDFPVAERLCSEVLSIPIHPLVTEDDVRFIAKAVKEGMKRNL
ncbi:MAG TPA: DegT/DnrJ/EryC1/StrS family aminotransferase, partial [Candidatus Nanoarchaeia archaeon]|nr:DegT/DnrJ/EryC1/StrS family aminotransferase [Candidatus Nanoarchaeia archaeon]